MLQGCRSWDTSHVRRTANEAAHRIENMAISPNVNQLWLTSTPPYIRDVVLAKTTLFY